MSVIALCMTCKGRACHVEETLPRNLADNADCPACKVVLVDYNSDDHLAALIKTDYKPFIDTGRLVYYRFTEPTPFRMAHAKNLAHRLGMREGADILVNVDADNFTNKGFARYVLDRFAGFQQPAEQGHVRRCPGMFMRSSMVKGKLTRGINGRIAVTKHAFLAAGGYDEVFNTWSPDDKDFDLRLRSLGYQPVEVDGRYLRAIPHTDKLRFKEYPHVEQDQTGEDFSMDGRRHLTVTNFGKVGCGVVYRNFAREPIVLGPLPTRVFGIGMHKTATSSLHAAFKLLGYDSWHWRSAHEAKWIWEEMQEGRSKTLEQYYSLSDLPIPLLFRQLDEAYPGSKFILTIRDEESWLDSVRWHWSGQNKFRGTWDSDPFSHQVHKLLYGQRGFDEGVMRARYRQHNKEVKEWFKGRPDDLLVLNGSKNGGADWHELCGFLREPIPAVPYPRHFQSGANGYVPQNGKTIMPKKNWLKKKLRRERAEATNVSPEDDDPKQAVDPAREAALAKLTVEEQRVLGLV